MPLYNYSDVTFGITIDGDGRHDSLVLRPITPQSFVAWSPPGALNTTSSMFREESIQPVTAGTASWHVNYAQLVASLPFVPTYVAYTIGNVANVQSWSMKGNVSDVGIALNPNYALVIALPNPLPVGWYLGLYVNCNANNVVVNTYIW
jgi:hypothetical protein